MDDYYDIKVGKKSFRESVILAEDSGGWDPSGWILGLIGDEYYFTYFSHCSCYGTWTSLGGPEWMDYDDDNEYTLSVNWRGSKKEFDHIAKNYLDIGMLPSERRISEDDYDHEYIKRIYDQWNDKFGE